MIECSEIRKKIDLFLDGMVDPHEKKRIEEHLSQCKDCSAEIESIKSFDEKAAIIKRVAMPPSLQTNIIESLKAGIVKKESPDSQESFFAKLFEKLDFFWKPAVAFSGVILAIIIFSAFPQGSPVKPGETYFSADIKFLKGKLQILRDGKEVMVEKGSGENLMIAKFQPSDKIVSSGESESEINFPGLVSLKVLSNTGIEWRNNEVFINRGKAALTFSKLKDPFTVKTPHLAVEVVGTELGFDVGDVKTLMYLVSGSVRIKIKDELINVKPGSMVSAETGREPVVSSISVKKSLRELLKPAEMDVKPNDSNSW